MTDPTTTTTTPVATNPLPADKVLAAIVDFVNKSEVDVQNALTQATAANNHHYNPRMDSVA